jgi:hypothetical protein
MNIVKRSDGPRGFGLRQPSAAFDRATTSQSGRGLPQSKALSRETHFCGGQKQISIA